MIGITTKVEGPLVINSVVGRVKLDSVALFLRKNVDSWTDKPILLDLSRMDFEHIFNNDLQKFIDKIKPDLEKRGCGKTAVIAPNDVQYGMMRVYQSLAENSYIQVQYKIFRNVSKAKAWLLEGAPKTNPEETA